MQWFALVARSTFSIFHAVYDFARREPQACEVELDLEAGTNTTLTASDASPAFGFGQ